MPPTENLSAPRTALLLTSWGNLQIGIVNSSKCNWNDFEWNLKFINVPDAFTLSELSALWGTISSLTLRCSFFGHIVTSQWPLEAKGSEAVALSLNRLEILRGEHEYFMLWSLSQRFMRFCWICVDGLSTLSK